MALPDTQRTLKDHAKISSILTLGMVNRIFVLFRLQLIARFLSFGPSVFDPVLLRAMFFVGACFGLAKLIEIDRLDQA